MFGQGFSFSGYERDPLYLNLGGKTFTDISGVSGIDSITDGRAGVFADFDNDGDLDVFSTTIQNQVHLLFRNNVGQNNNYVRRLRSMDAAEITWRIRGAARDQADVLRVLLGQIPKLPESANAPLSSFRPGFRCTPVTHDDWRGDHSRFCHFR